MALVAAVVALVLAATAIGVGTLPSKPTPITRATTAPVASSGPSPNPRTVTPGEYAGVWRSMAPAPIAGRFDFGVGWTGSELVIWGGAEPETEGLPRGGAAYDPAADSWRVLPDAPIAGRLMPHLAWTGSELIVWGGTDRVDGAAYNPAANLWRVLPNAPIDPTLVPVSGWLAGRFVVVTDRRAAAYDPTTDQWSELEPAPIRKRWRVGAVVADRLVVLAFGDGATGDVEGAVLQPDDWTWAPIADIPLEAADAGVELIATGLRASVPWTGAQYDPLAGEWAAAQGCPNTGFGAVWTGRMVVDLDHAWDPATGACLTVPEPPDRPPELGNTNVRADTIGVWSGREYLTWGGGIGLDGPPVAGNDGVVFRPDEP